MKKKKNKNKNQKKKNKNKNKNKNMTKEFFKRTMKGLVLSLSTIEQNAVANQDGRVLPTSQGNLSLNISHEPSVLVQVQEVNFLKNIERKKHTHTHTHKNIRGRITVEDHKQVKLTGSI